MLHGVGPDGSPFHRRCRRPQPRNSDRRSSNHRNADHSKHNLAAEFLTLEFWAGYVNRASLSQLDRHTSRGSKWLKRCKIGPRVLSRVGWRCPVPEPTVHYRTIQDKSIERIAERESLNKNL